MTDFEWRKKFIRFLKELGIYRAYLENIGSKKCDGATKDGTTFASYVFFTHELDMVSAAFDWMNSPQGHWYWSRINNIWVNYVKTNVEPIYEHEKSELLKLIGCAD